MYKKQGFRNLSVCVAIFLCNLIFAKTEFKVHTTLAINDTLKSNDYKNLTIHTDSAGMVIPVVDDTTDVLVSNKKAGLLVYNNDNKSIWYYNGENFTDIVAPNQKTGICSDPNTGIRSHCYGTSAGSCADYRYPSDAAYEYSGDTGSGIYTLLDVSGNYYCEMDAFGGGWTLVYKNKPSSKLAINNASQQGSVSSCLSTLTDNCSAKLSDGDIASLVKPGQNNSRASYYLTNASQSINYFAPNGCTYSHFSPGTNGYCRQVSASYVDGNLSYTQFNNWGGKSGGIDAWYHSSAYRNTVNTHRDYSYPESAGITSNYSFAGKGSSNTGYGHTVYMFVRRPL